MLDIGGGKRSKLPAYGEALRVMKDISETRRDNFRRLVEKLGGTRNAAIALDMNESQVSQLGSPKIRKAMGSRLARQIEAKAGLPHGSLDMPVAFSGQALRTIPVLSLDEIEQGDPLTHGFDEGRPYVVWDFSNPYRPQRDLFAVYAPDDAMAGTINERDLVIFEAQNSAPPRPGSIVIAKTTLGPAIRLLKQPNTEQYELLAASDLYAPITLDSAAAILGSMVEVRWFRAKHTKRD